jgi:hypothetical protein
MLATCQLKRYHTQFQEVVIRSIPISDCSGQCEWHGSGRVMAGERHGMCESALSGLKKANDQWFCNKLHKPREMFLIYTWFKFLLAIKKAEVRYSNLKNGLADVGLKNEQYIFGLNTTSFLSDLY